MNVTTEKRAICGNQYSHVGPQRETEAEAIADARPYADAGGKLRIVRVLKCSKATGNRNVIRFQAHALGRKKVKHTTGGVCNSFGVSDPKHLEPVTHAGIWVDRGGEWVKEGQEIVDSGE